MPSSLFQAAQQCLASSEPAEKQARSHAAWNALQRGELCIHVAALPPELIEMPGRPERPRLIPIKQLPQRGLGSVAGRAAFLHAIAHIEFNAIDLAWDAVYRFRGLPLDYYLDWARIASDEARHFGWLQERLAALGHGYGDFDAHNGLWDMATRTSHSLIARMALVPRVLEARGLDVTPGMILKLVNVGDAQSAAVLERILEEEIPHVAAGSRWFRWACAREGVDPEAHFLTLVREHAVGALRGPFNRSARLESGFAEAEIDGLCRLART
jgi:uncharacterized ferritin-like protein (DUF455 family)